VAGRTTLAAAVELSPEAAGPIPHALATYRTSDLLRTVQWTNDPTPPPCPICSASGLTIPSRTTSRTSAAIRCSSSESHLDDRRPDPRLYNPSVNPAETASRPLRVALLGLGTVGKAVAQQLLSPQWRASVAARGIVPPELVAIGVRDPDRPRGIDIPGAVRRTDALAELAGAGDVDCVVELIGDPAVAWPVVHIALEAGKPVVTANKALLATHGGDVEAVSRECRAALRFEAAVAGGTPVLGPIVRDLAGNRIEAVRGIINGTTNHILTAMAEDGRDYADVLAESKARGYAEADPSTDVEGRDAAHKLAILTRLAFGEWPDVAALRRCPPSTRGESSPGIAAVTAREQRRAAALGLTIKLVARAQRGRDGCVRASVTPLAVRATSQLGDTGGVTNLVEVIAEPVGRVAFRGPGAGGPATASAVLSDVLAIARGEGSTWGALPPAPSTTVADDLSDEHSWFFVAEDLAGGDVPSRLTDIVLAASNDALVTRPIALQALRERLMATDIEATLYPVLAEA
jgi:homoserine dehydrogenase